jgi:hypothetical protein
MDKVGINNIKNSCTSHILLKKGTHVTFTDYVRGPSLKENSIRFEIWKWN